MTRRPANVVYVIWTAQGVRCTTVHETPSGPADALAYVAGLVEDYDTEFPDRAPHHALRYEHKPEPTLASLYRIPV